ncbi:MAG: AAA family ATPase [Pirellulales bacterium]|nr:AAA family ATPase [Pirellulales bacterium]
MTVTPPNGSDSPVTQHIPRLESLLGNVQQVGQFPVQISESSADASKHCKLPVAQQVTSRRAASQSWEATQNHAMVETGQSPGQASRSLDGGSWFPVEPDSLVHAGLSESAVEGLILKCLNNRAEMTGRQLSGHICLPFRLVEPLLASLKIDRLIAHKGAAMVNDYIYQLTELGRERAKKLAEFCAYAGAAPVPLRDYIESVGFQSLSLQHPSRDDLCRAFSDMLIDEKMLDRLGPAINSSCGLFLFGAAGNGKTSIAERITRVFGQTIWIPRVIGINGEIMRFYDPGSHEEAPPNANDGIVDDRRVDARWVRIRRPTVVVGGELTMGSLEVAFNTATNVSEAPVQMKSNCGVLVIDDFGRQQMRTDQLLNRLIVPLDKRYDFLNLSGGKKIEVPFDQLIVFSTNLEPRDLVDEAFLRRIPYKIEVADPDESEFRRLFEIAAPAVGMEYDREAVDYLIKTYYQQVNRPFRCCQPWDLLHQIASYCRYLDEPARMTPVYFDYAVENYFSVI